MDEKMIDEKRYSEHLQWIHDRIVNVYGESENVDFLIKLREIVKYEKDAEVNLQKYIEFINKRRKEYEQTKE